jgi:nucleoside-diphosphate-sugar epimerase
VRGDIRDAKAVKEALVGADCVWHNAAAVGPYHPQELYRQVNYEGTLHVIAACRELGIRKIVMSSSPSTRFTGEDIDGLSEAQMPAIPMKSYLQEYAATKALGEKALTDACDGKTLLTVAVAPHQVYGPRDNLFLPNILEAAGTGRLRILGDGKNRICFTHVDNYCHGLILGEKALYPGSPALGKFYIVTDMESHTHSEGYGYLYEELDKAIVGMGWQSVYTKWSIPRWFLMPIAYLCLFITMLTGIKIKLTPFVVLMMSMHRWFDCSAAVNDLGYRPIKSFSEEWPATIKWFKKHWLPDFERSSKGLAGLYQGTQKKIDIQAAGSKAKNS